MDSSLVYLDVCALNRPFDDQEQMRIRLETDATLLILGHVRAGSLKLFRSPTHRIEIAANPDVSQREHISQLLDDFGAEITCTLSQVRKRAEQLAERGMGVADAAHVAFAEAASCDFVTVDDRLLRQCKRCEVEIWTGTPISYCEKEDLR